MSAGVSWAEFAAAMPEMAAAGRRLLYQFGPGLGYLATVRPDGGPRVHPVCPHVAEGALWVFVGETSPKFRDLARSGALTRSSTPGHGPVSRPSRTSRGRRRPSPWP
jgi:hypothetical protein